jgi:hypothetical protein
MERPKMKSWWWVIGCWAVCSAVSLALGHEQVFSQEKKPATGGLPLKVKVNEPAPDFTLDAILTKDGKLVEGKVSLRDFRGRKNVVLYFFPKASTPG